MKWFLQILFSLDIILLLYGFYIKSQDEFVGNRYVGIAVLVFAFIFLPLFIYYRYKGKDLRKYTDLDKMLRENSELYKKDK